MAARSARNVRALGGRLRRALGRLLHRSRGVRATAERPTAVDPEVVELVVELLSGATAPRIAVLSTEGSGGLAEALRGRLPAAGVEVVVTTGSASDRHVALTVAGPFDLVVDATETVRGRVSRFQDAFFQLLPGGHLVVLGAGAALPGAEGPGESSTRGPLAELLRGARARAGEDRPGGKKASTQLLDEHAIAEALTDARRSGDHLVLCNGALPALGKLREAEANLVIARLPHLGHRVLETVEGARFTSRCELHESAETRGPNQPNEYDAPAVFLREYRDLVVAPGQVVADDRFLWPDTFRHNARRRIRNSHTIETAPGYARLPFGTDELPVLEGAYFHLDNEVRGHFGHLLTEQVSRLWGWTRAKELNPDLKVLVGTNRRPELMSYELTVYAAGGIPPEDVVLIREPVRVERLLSSTPMLSHPEYVHPAIAATWRRVGDALAADARGGPRPPRIFCSRRIRKRECTNTAEVEDLFREAGFEVIFPEDHPLGDQVEMFRSADVLAGFAGSGLFNLCFVPDPTRVIMIGSDAYTARNEYLFASVLGHRLDVITSVADVPGDFQSSFSFDVDREGRFLAETLAALPG